MTHPVGFTVNRPQGSGCWVFVCFRSPVQIRHCGPRTEAQPGDCIWYAPDSPVWYRGATVGLSNDWFHLHHDGCGDLLAHYHLPVQTLFRPFHVDFIAPLINRMQDEVMLQRPHWPEAVGLLTEELMLLLSRAVHLDLPDGLSTAEAAHLPRFAALRTEIVQNLDQPWSTNSMAARINLSPPRFSALYRRFFGISPRQDLINARLHLAKELLHSGGASVAAVATRCGFASAGHFSRFFRARTGVAPREWRRGGAA